MNETFNYRTFSGIWLKYFKKRNHFDRGGGAGGANKTMMKGGCDADVTLLPASLWSF